MKLLLMYVYIYKLVCHTCYGEWCPLQERRTSSSVFAGKYGLITLRDLFRWAERYRQSPTTTHQFRDWEQQLAEDGEYEWTIAHSIVYAFVHVCAIL